MRLQEIRVFREDAKRAWRLCLEVGGVECHKAEETGDKTSNRKGENLSHVRKRQSKNELEKTYPSREDEGNLAPVHSAKIVVHQSNTDG